MIFLFIILNLDIIIITKVFKLDSKINIKYTIFIDTNIYKIRINNLNIKLVI